MELEAVTVAERRVALSEVEARAEARAEQTGAVVTAAREATQVAEAEAAEAAPRAMEVAAKAPAVGEVGATVPQAVPHHALDGGAASSSSYSCHICSSSWKFRRSWHSNCPRSSCTSPGCCTNG